MEQRFYATEIIFICLLFAFMSCKNNKEDSNIKLINSLINDISPLKDSIDKLSKIKSVKLLIFKVKEDNLFYKLSIEKHNLPYAVVNRYKIEKKNNIYLLIESNDKLELNSNIRDKLSDELQNKGLVTFKPKTNYTEEGPYLKFIICKKNKSKISAFDNIMASKEQLSQMQKGLQYEESIFYPTCK